MRFFFISLGFTILTISCSSKPKIVLSQKEMANVLTDLHYADAVGTSLSYLDFDSAGIYNWVFKKNNITRAVFDTSMAYYSVHNDKLVNIYSKVQANLARKEAEFKENEEKRNINKSQALFENNTTYRLPFDGQTSKIPFELPFNSNPGEYSIVVRLKIFNIDQSVNPHLTAYFWFDDNTPQGHAEYFNTINYEKNNRTTTHTVTHSLNDTRFTHIKGFILDDDNVERNFLKHAEVYSIKVSFIKND